MNYLQFMQTKLLLFCLYITSRTPIPKLNPAQFTILYRTPWCPCSYFKVFCFILCRSVCGTVFMKLAFLINTQSHQSGLFPFFSGVFQSFLAVQHPSGLRSAPGSVLWMTMSIMCYEDHVSSVHWLRKHLEREQLCTGIFCQTPQIDPLGMLLQSTAIKVFLLFGGSKTHSKLEDIIT